MAIHVESKPTNRQRLPTPFGPAGELVLKNAATIAGVLAESPLVRPEQFLVAAIAEVNSLELLNRSQLEPKSVVRAVFNCATLGLLLGPTLGHAYLVPYRKKGTDTKIVNLIPGYRGLIELAFRSHFLKDLDTEVVLEGETFRSRMTESGRVLRHDLPLERVADKDGRNLTGAYCVYHTRHGGRGITVVTRQEIEAVKNASSDTWRFSYPAMARKTAVRRAAKNWSLSEQLSSAVHLDEQAERGEDQIILPGARGIASEMADQSKLFGSAQLPESDSPETERISAEELADKFRASGGVLSDGMIASLIDAFLSGSLAEPEFHALRLQYLSMTDPRSALLNSMAESTERRSLELFMQDVNSVNQSGILSPELYRQLLKFSRKRMDELR